MVASCGGLRRYERNSGVAEVRKDERTESKVQRHARHRSVEDLVYCGFAVTGTTYKEFVIQ